MSADDELWGLTDGNTLQEVPAKFGEAFDHIRNAFGRVEAGNLCDIAPGWVRKLWHRVISAFLIEVVEVEVVVPVPHVLVQTVEPFPISV